MKFEIKKAQRRDLKARVALIGVSGSGKTYDGLLLAAGLARQPDGTRGRVIVIDTENRSASKYADDPALGVDFDVLELDTFAPATYVEALRFCEEQGAAAILVDSLSHAWMGKDGALEMVDRAAARSNSRNSFDAWRSVTPQHNALVNALLRCKAHLVVTMRAKTDYVVEEVNGRKVPRKVGLAPVQRDGMEYEFDVVAEIDGDHRLIVTKSRCSALADAVVEKENVRRAVVTLREWLTSGAPEPEATAPASPEEPATSPSAESTTPAAPPLDPDDNGPAPSELDGFLARVAEIELPGEAVAVWRKHRAELAGLPAATREYGWKAICCRTEVVGKMKNARVWLKKALAEEDAREGQRPAANGAAS